MKILPAVVFLLGSFFFSQLSLAQDGAIQDQAVSVSKMQDTTIVLDPSFKIRNDARKTGTMQSGFNQGSTVWNSKMRDTIIIKDPSFIVLDLYAEKDSLDAIIDPVTAKRNAIRESLNAIGAALMHAADMQDTTIILDPAFVVREVYARKDSLKAIRDSIRALLVQASQMQDTVIELDPSFIVSDVYATKDKKDAISDSIRATLAQAAAMQDTTIELEPSFMVRKFMRQWTK
jgi:hypothetical protein